MRNNSENFKIRRTIIHPGKEGTMRMKTKERKKRQSILKRQWYIGVVTENLHSFFHMYVLVNPNILPLYLSTG